MSWKLIIGVFLLFTGFLSIAGVGLILLYILDEYKKTKVRKATLDAEPVVDNSSNTDTYISPSVIEEFR